MQAKQSSVRALERGLDMLECLREASGPLSLSEVAERVSLSPSTAVRILSTLEMRGFVDRDPGTKQYSLGERSQMTRGKSSSLELLFTMASGPIQELSARFDESISLYVPQGNKRVCVKRAESSHPLRQVVNVGDSLPISMGAGGKVLCAWLALQADFDPSELMPPVSEDTLRQIRENGYGTSFGEREAGTYAVAAPVFGAGGKIVAALTLAGPVVRFNPDMLKDMSDALKMQARAISTAIGWEGGEG